MPICTRLSGILGVAILLGGIAGAASANIQVW